MESERTNNGHNHTDKVHYGSRLGLVRREWRVSRECGRGDRKPQWLVRCGATLWTAPTASADTIWRHWIAEDGRNDISICTTLNLRIPNVVCTNTIARRSVCSPKRQCRPPVWLLLFHVALSLSASSAGDRQILSLNVCGTPQQSKWVQASCMDL
jgi:hypothetical protein